MSRELTPAIVDRTEQALGTEPFLVVEVRWRSGGTLWYADKTDIDKSYLGQLLNVSSLQSQLNQQTFGTVATINVTLSDIDDAIKTKYDSQVVEDIVVNVHQAFEDEIDTVIILHGKLKSPKWEEGTHKFSFTIDTSYRDEDLLLEIKETSVDFPDPESIGTVFPLCFGTVLRLPAVQVSRSITGELLTSLYMWTSWYVEGTTAKVTAFDQNFRVKNGERFPRESPIYLEIDKTLFFGEFNHPTIMDMFMGDEISYNTTFGTVKVIARDEDDFDYKNASCFWVAPNTYDLKGKQLWMRVKIAQYHYTANDIQYKVLAEDHAGVTKDAMGNVVVTEEYNNYVDFYCTCTDYDPDNSKVFINTPFVTPFGEVKALTVVEEDDAFIKEIRGQLEYRWNDLPDPGSPLRWDIGAGARVKEWAGLMPVFVCNSVESTAILEVLGKRNGRFQAVPSSYYTIDLAYEAIVNGNEEILTVIIMDQFLTDREKEGWDSDQIYVSLTSTIEPNTVDDVITWMITNRTDLTIDTSSFGSVGNDIENYPSHFAYLTQRPASQAIQECAWQSRVGIYIDSGVAYATYLSKDPEDDPPGYMITVDETVVNLKTLVITRSDSSEIYTKFTGYWNKDYSETEKRKVIYFNNEEFFDKKDFEADFLCYNIESLVQKSSLFWSNRYSNSWTIISFSTYFKSLSVQLWDYITIHLAAVNGGAALIGQVISISQNPETYTFDLTVWLPLTLGDGEPYLDDSGDVMPPDPGESLSESDYLILTDRRFIWNLPGLNAPPVVAISLPEDTTLQTYIDALETNKANALSDNNKSRDKVAKAQVTAATLDESYAYVHANLLTPCGKVLLDEEDNPIVVKIATPSIFHRSYWDFDLNGGVLIDGVKYLNVGDGVRTADGVTETIDPPYLRTPESFGTLDVAYRPEGTGVIVPDGEHLGWYDLNTSGRHWQGPGGGAAQTSYMCRIDAYLGSGMYTVTAFPNGKDDPTGSFETTAVLLNQQLAEPIPLTSWVVAIQGEITAVPVI